MQTCSLRTISKKLHPERAERARGGGLEKSGLEECNKFCTNEWNKSETKCA